jgi:glutathione synthase/RimK-type ligase-like ATP-grasp enzyme
MKKIVIIGSRHPGTKNDAHTMAEHIAQKQAALQVTVVYWEDLLFSINLQEQSVIDTASGTDLADAGHVIAINWYKGGKQAIYKDAAYTLALYLQHHDVTFWNQEMATQRSTSKLSTMMQLALLGCDIPATRYSLSAAVLQAQAQQLPCILKAAQASRGRANYLITDQASYAARLSQTQATNPYLAQEYIANEYDLRIVCFDGEPSMVMKRQRQDSKTHLNNVSQGAEATILDKKLLGPAILQSCRDICHVMGRNIAGIDLLPANDGTDRKVFLEVNAIPQLTSGSFISDKLAALADSLTQAERKEV